MCEFGVVWVGGFDLLLLVLLDVVILFVLVGVFVLLVLVVV